MGIIQHHIELLYRLTDFGVLTPLLYQQEKLVAESGFQEYLTQHNENNFKTRRVDQT
jgi:hypothetical protein